MKSLQAINTEPLFKCGWRPLTFLFLFVLWATPNLLAQDVATLLGTVTDPTDAVVAGVQITATHETTSVAQTTVTNSAGSYYFPALPIGSYTLQAKREGFQTAVRSAIVLNVRNIVRLDLQLKLGAVTQEVKVTANPLHLETSSGEVSTLISGSEVSEIAIDGRNFVQLATLVPGASSELPSFNVPLPVSGSSSISFDGARVDHNVWNLDGLENYDRGCGGCINTLPSIEAISEFQVQTSSMRADTGFASGGQIQVAIKSGTRNFHGELYEFLRNNALDANDFFSNLAGRPTPPLKLNNFGYTFGGPVYIPGHYNTAKTKTFFFWSQDWRRLIQSQSIFVPTPPTSWRTGDFSSFGSPVILDHTQPVTLPDGTTGYKAFSNNQIPQSMLDLNAQILSSPDSIFPLPNAAGSIFYSAAPSTKTTVREEIIRVDHNISDKSTVMFRSLVESISQGFPTTMWSGDSYPTVGTRVVETPSTTVMKYARAISPSLLNEVSVSYQRSPLDLLPTGLYQRPSNLTIPSVYPGKQDSRIPEIDLYGPVLGTAYTVAFLPWISPDNTWTYRDVLTKSQGNHMWSVGFQYLRFLKEQPIFVDSQGDFGFNGGATGGSYLGASGTIQQTTGNEFADFMLGQSYSYSEAKAETNPGYVANNLGAWFTDTWKIRQGLTLNYGVRWEGMPHTVAQHNNVASFRPQLFVPADAPQINPDGSIVPGSGNLINGMALSGQNGIPRGLVENHWALFEPRVGFAWQPLGSSKTVIRAGYGLFYERLQGNDIYDVAPNPPFVGSASIFNASLSNPGGGTGEIFPANTQNFDPQYLPPYFQQYSFGLERQINPKAILSVMYVGSHGTHQQINRNINQPLSPAGQSQINAVRPYRGYGTIDWFENSTSSGYNSLQVSLRTTNWHGLTSGVAYTWSHSIDFASGDVPGVIQNAYDVAAERGNSDFDRRQMLIFNYVYSLPFFKTSTGPQQKVLGGWEISGITTFQSGRPFSVGFPGDPAEVGGAPYRADLVGDPNSGPGIHTPGEWFNTAAFAPVPTGSFGNSARNVVVGQGLNNFDVSLVKNILGIPFPGKSEGLALQFRAEFFNFFNHTQFNGYFTEYGTTGFGGANSTRDPRIIQFGLKLMF